MYYAQGLRFVVFVVVEYRPIFTEYASGYWREPNTSKGTLENIGE